MARVSFFAPIFTFLSLVGLVLVLIPGPHISALRQYSIDMTGFKAAVARGDYLLPGDKVSDSLLFALRFAAKANQLSDRYDVFLLNECAVNPDQCSQPSVSFAFNPVEAWNLNAILDQRHLPSALGDPISNFNIALHWLLATYLAALLANAITLISYLFAAYSRFASGFSNVLVFISVFFSLGAAVTSTVLFSLLVNQFFNTLSAYQITVARGIPALAIDWTSFALSALAAIVFVRTHLVQRRRARGAAAMASAKAPAGAGYRPFALSRGYQHLDDQEKSLMPDAEEAEARAAGIEMQETTYGGAETSALVSSRTDEVYEPFRHA